MPQMLADGSQLTVPFWTGASAHSWVFRGHFFLDFPVSSKNNAHFIQKRSIRNKTLNWKVVLVRVRTFPLISRRFPLISRRFPLIFWDTTCKSRFPLIFSFSAQNLKRAKKMPRAPKSDQMEDPGLCDGVCMQSTRSVFSPKQYTCSTRAGRKHDFWVNVQVDSMGMPGCLCFHYPGNHFGFTLFLTHSHIARTAIVCIFARMRPSTYWTQSPSRGPCR